MDQTYAMALRIAEDRLKSLGWKFSCKDVGAEAANIINAFYINLRNELKPAVEQTKP